MIQFCENFDKSSASSLTTTTTTKSLHARDQKLREIFGSVFQFHCFIIFRLDYEDCVANSQNFFDQWMQSGVSVPADIKDIVYNTGVRTGNSTHWNFILDQFQTTKVRVIQILSDKYHYTMVWRGVKSQT